MEVSSRAGSGVVVLRIECVSGVVETVVDGVPVQTSSSTIEERRIPVIPEAPSSAVVVDVPTGSDCSVDVAEPGGGTVVEARGGAGLLAPGGTLIGVRVTTAGDPTTVGVVLEFPVQVAGEQAGRPDPVPPAVGGLPATGGRPGRLAALGATCLAAGLVLARAARRRPRAPA
ncbi:MAG: hypothetical protein M5U14_17930 [Acidimicrobiia bacterium]|nr:hypothetical protein [Acidimicrobiia bacterium]